MALGPGAPPAYHPPGSVDGGAESYRVGCGLDRVAHNPTPGTPGPGCSAPARERRECSHRPWTPTAVRVCCLTSERIVPVQYARGSSLTEKHSQRCHKRSSRPAASGRAPHPPTPAHGRLHRLGVSQKGGPGPLPRLREPILLRKGLSLNIFSPGLAGDSHSPSGGSENGPSLPRAV